MKMRPALASPSLLFLFLFVASVESRKDPGMVEGLQGLLPLKSEIQSEKNPKHKCEEKPLVTNTKVIIEKEVITEDFGPRPSATAYNHDDTSATLKKKLVKDFDPRPSITAYNDEVGPKGEKLTTVNSEFEPRPSATAYNDENIDAMLKKRIVKNSEFETRPSVTAYNNEVIGATLKNKFVKNFEFGNNGKKPMINDEFEPRPSATRYND